MRRPYLVNNKLKIFQRMDHYGLEKNINYYVHVCYLLFRKLRGQ